MVVPGITMMVGERAMHRPGKPMPLAAIAGCCVLLTTAAAAAAPDIRGTWAISGHAIVVGAAPTHPATEGSGPRLRPFADTMRVEGQEDQHFWGSIESETAREEFIGMFTGVGSTFIRVDFDGFAEGELHADGTIRYCYRHVTAGSRVVSCGTATRR